MNKGRDPVKKKAKPMSESTYRRILVEQDQMFKHHLVSSDHIKQIEELKAYKEFLQERLYNEKKSNERWFKHLAFNDALSFTKDGAIIVLTLLLINFVLGINVT